MTTIAYRDGVLAADSQVTASDTIVGRLTKVVRGPDGALGAACGDSPWCRLFREWVLGGRDGDAPLPTRLPDGSDNAKGILIAPDGSVWSYEAGGHCGIGGDYMAWGSGRDLALGAMAHGATAAEAIAATIKHCPYTGGEVETVNLSGWLEASTVRFAKR